MDTPDWMNSVNLAFSPKKIDMKIKKFGSAHKVILFISKKKVV